MYLDFDSLYPCINFEGNYMMGHPQCETFYTDVEWTKPDDIIHPRTKQKFTGGWYQVRVLAPRGLYLTVIPVRFDNRYF